MYGLVVFSECLFKADLSNLFKPALPIDPARLDGLNERFKEADVHFSHGFSLFSRFFLGCSTLTAAFILQLFFC